MIAAVPRKETQMQNPMLRNDPDTAPVHVSLEEPAPAVGEPEEKGAIGIALVVWLLGGGLGLALLVFLLAKVF
jgi:hypothetical protein